LQVRQTTYMIVFKKADELTRYLLQQRAKERSIGFVPTMGALHPGHLSLIGTAKKEEAITVCSIFVNPTQFNNSDDFKRYPVTVEEDIKKLLTVDCDVLFLPATEEIYPEGYVAKHYDLGELETVLEGHYRPGHFQGVCQVVHRLLEIVQPAALYLGQKDYQQCMVIERLIAVLGKQNNIQLKILPTLRESDGLAMSSRNLRLSEIQRQTAPALYESLLYAKTHLANDSLEKIKQASRSDLAKKGFAVDYFEIADAHTLLPPSDKNESLVALVAASLDGIRLIDNLPLN